jgi:CHASE2 domain-containing sensor protein
MNILLTLVLFLFIVVTSGTNVYQAWQAKNKKMLLCQFGIIGLSILGVILIIFDIDVPSFSSLMNLVSPF